MTIKRGIILWTCVLLCFCAGYTSGKRHHGGRHHTKKACAEISRCLQPFPMLVDLVQDDDAAALATLTYDVLLDSVCSHQNQLTKCLDETKCSDFEQTYKGRAILDSLTYICGIGRNVLLTEKSCFFRDEFARGIYQCSRTMQMETEITTLQVQTNLAAASSFCTVFSNLLKCVESSVKRTCSEQAAAFARHLYGHSIKAMARHIGCTITLT